MKPRRLAVSVLAAVLASLASGRSSAQPGSTFERTNVGVASDEWYAQGLTGAFLASEAAQRQDLNGDGDTDDLVVFVYDAATDTVSNLGLAVQNYPVLVADDLVVFSVSEIHQGNTDLNGNGNAFDDVLHVFDRRTHAVTNLGLAGFPMACNSGFAALGVGEFAQGSDLNGDGDLEDCVVHVYDSSTGVTRNLGLDCGSNASVFRNGLLAFSVDESRQGNTDLDGDGDAVDLVVHAYDARADAIFDTGLATRGYAPLVAGTLVVVEVDEAGQGNTDLNGDGDAFDDCALGFDIATGTVVNFHAAIDGVCANDLVIGLAVNEALQGETDLDGDGEISGVTLFVIDTATLTVRNLALQMSDRRAMTAIGAQLAFSVGENNGAPRDLNGDGDTRDQVLFVHDSSTGMTTNLRLAISDVQFFPFRESAAQLCFTVRESDQRADLNGDGDLGDRVFHVYDSTDGSVTNLGVGANEFVGAITASASLFGFRVSESGQGNRDANGDGDTDDRIVYVYDFVRRSLHGTRVAATGEPAVGDGFALFGASEARQGGHDLNRDGDAFDNVVQTFRRVDPASCESGSVGSDVLRMNAAVGTVSVARNAPVTLSLAAAPAGPASTPYLLWVWTGASLQPTTLRLHGARVGCLVNPSPFDPAFPPQPAWCLHSATTRCGAPPSLPSPASAPFSTTRAVGFARPLTLVIQGMVRDEAAPNPLRVSTTNAVTLRVM
jgi:hypothetical protein